MQQAPSKSSVARRNGAVGRDFSKIILPLSCVLVALRILCQTSRDSFKKILNFFQTSLKLSLKIDFEKSRTINAAIFVVYDSSPIVLELPN